MKKTMPATIFLLLFFVTATASAGDFRMENDRFVIQHAAGDKRLAAELNWESLHIRERIVRDIGADFTAKTEIRLCPTLEAFREAQSGGSWIPIWAAGVAYPDENVIVIRSPQAVKGSRIDVADSFTHVSRSFSRLRIRVTRNTSSIVVTPAITFRAPSLRRFVIPRFIALSWI